MSTGRIGPTTDNQKLLVLMDGHAIIHRAFYAIQQPMILRRTGEDLSAVYGFTNTFLRMLKDWKPTHIAIAFDLSGPTFRHEEFDQYKAQRPPTPPELRSQFDRVRQLMETFGVPIFEMKRFEADDVLGTLCRQAGERRIKTIVLTGDTDELQLVSPWVRVQISHSTQKTTIYDDSKVRDRYGGLGPEMVPDIKALQGDSSDNIPGVPLVGFKTAIKLLNEFDSLEGIYRNIDNVAPPRIQKSLRENEELARQGKYLATIVTDLPVDLDLDEAKFGHYDSDVLANFLRDLGFFSILPRLPDLTEYGQTDDEINQPRGRLERETKYGVVDTSYKLSELKNQLNSVDGFSFVVDTAGVNAMSDKIVGIGFSTSADVGWYVPVGHVEGRQLNINYVMDELRPVIEDELIPKTAHNANFAMTTLSRHGINLKGLVFDTMVAAHVGGRKALAISELTLECLNIEMPSTGNPASDKGVTISMADVSIEERLGYMAAKADLILQLRSVLENEMDEQCFAKALDMVETPLVPVLVKMQINGVSIDVNHLEQMSLELGNEIKRNQDQMYSLLGYEFNIGSSKQLADVLFNVLRLPQTKKTKTGFSTDASAIEGLRKMMDRDAMNDVDPRSIEVLDRVLEYRQLTKIKSTYVDSLPGQIFDETGRIHTNYQQTGSATGRVSSNDPHVQNIPVRTELGRRVRNAFVAQDAPEWILLGADYSQIELRVLAHLSLDPGLLEAFNKGVDIHSATAASVFGVGVKEVTQDMRRVAKIMNFGVIYGLSPFGISQQTGLSPEEGKTFTEKYFGKYPGIRHYIDSIKEQVSTKGYVETLVGRRRYIPEIKSNKFQVRAAGERMAVNMPIQGTAADIIKLAMIRIQDKMDQLQLHSMMILQVHDELIFEVPQGEFIQMKELVTDLMQSAMQLTVPLEVDIKTGHNWGDMR